MSSMEACCVKQEEEEEEGGDGGEDEVDLCILCCSPAAQVNSLQNSEHLLSANLSVVFLLRKVLQVPGSQLEENLRECGNPMNWIRLCEQCTQLTRQAEQLHCQIVRTNEQLRCVEQLILERRKVPSSSVSSVTSVSIDKKKSEGNRKRREIWRKIRAAISSNENSGSISLLNPFIQGDQLANHLQSHNSTSTLLFLDKKVLSSSKDSSGQHEGHVIKVEVEEDVDWEPPPEMDEWDEEETKASPTSKPASNPKRSRRKGKVKKGKPALRCHLCPRLTFRKQFVLNAHLFIRHKNDPLTAKLLESGYQLFRCEEYRCAAYFAKESSLEEHLRKAHNPNEPAQPKRFPCQFCEKDFGQKASVLQHERLHHHSQTGGELFTCDICGRELRSAYSLNVHKRKVHKIWKRGPATTSNTTGDGGGSGKRICHLCGRTLKDSHSLKKHLVCLHPEDPLAQQLIEEGYGVWRCEVPGCAFKYSSKCRLDEHVGKVHGGSVEQDKAAKSFFCACCGKGFYAEDALKRHEKFKHGDNEGEKPFKCQFCGFEVATQSYLDGHVKRVHRPTKKAGGRVKGELVVICDICGIQFAEKDADKLEKHKIIHDKGAEQPHACELCGRAYSTHESMWKHKRKVHKIYRRPDDSRILHNKK